MVLLVVLLTIVAFVVADLTLRMILKRIDQARAKKERLEALDVGLKIEVAEEAHSLKRVEVRKPKARILAVDDEPVNLQVVAAGISGYWPMRPTAHYTDYPPSFLNRG